jgi:NitT/TauT family transport system permease protein
MSQDKLAAQSLPKFAERFEDDQVFLVDPSIKARRRETAVVLIARVVLGIAAVMIWEWISNHWGLELWISSPSRIATACVEMWNSGGLTRNVYATVSEALVGFSIGAA